MMVTYAIALLSVVFLIGFSCMISLTVNTKRTFKKYDRTVKRSRAAVISSPRLQDAIFAINEKYKSFYMAEAEFDPEL